jgi:hypothetical protein
LPTGRSTDPLPGHCPSERDSKPAEARARYSLTLITGNR